MSTAENEVEQQLIPAGTPTTLADEVLLGRELGIQGRQMAYQNDPKTTDQEICAALATTLKMTVLRRKTIDELRKETNRAPQDQIKRTNEVCALALDPLTAAEKALKNWVSANSHWVEQEKAKAAEAEAKRIARNAEKRAERAEAKGDEYSAEEIRLQAELEAENAKAAIVSQPAPKTRGVSKRQNWKWEATDPQALMALIASGQDPRFSPDCLKFNEVMINKIVKAYGETLAKNPPPGMRVYYEDVIAVR